MLKNKTNIILYNIYYQEKINDDPKLMLAFGYPSNRFYLHPDNNIYFAINITM